MQRGRGERPARPGESIGKGLPLSRDLAVLRDRDESHLIAFVREGRAIESAVEGDERAMTVAVGELVALVEVHSVGRPMRSEVHQRLVERRAIYALRADDARTIAAVLGRQDLPVLEDGVVIAVGPSVVAAASNANELLGGQ